MGEDQPRLDAHHVERFEPHRLQPVLLAGLPDRVEHGERILRMTEDFVAEFAGIAGARHDDRRAFEIADAADGEAEPFELADRRLARRRPDDLLEDVAALRPLHGDIVHLVGRGAHPGLEAHLLGLLAQPDAAEIVAADPAEIVLAEPEHRAVVDHAAVLVAHGGIDDLAGRQLADVARQAILQQRLGIRSGHLEFAQRRQVDHRRASRGRPSIPRSARRC